MDGGDLLAAFAAGVLERGARNPQGSVFGDDLEALHHARNHFVLQAGVEVLGVLAEDGDVEREIVEARLEAGQRDDGAEVDVQPEFLAQGDVDALVAAADGGGGGALQPDARHFERSENVVGQQLALLGQGARAGIDAFPFDAGAGRLHRARSRIGHFGPDAVAGNQRDLMSHHRYYKVEAEA